VGKAGSLVVDQGLKDGTSTLNAPSMPPLFEVVTPMPYVALQQLFDEAGAWGLFGYEKGIQISTISDGAIEAITTHVSQRTSPMSSVLLYPLSGAYSEVDDDATAFGGDALPTSTSSSTPRRQTEERLLRNVPGFGHSGVRSSRMQLASAGMSTR